jgi:hypothetical protein
MITVIAEGLLGFAKQGHLGVPLVTGSTAPDPNSNVGAIGESHTVVAFGQGELNPGLMAGARLTARLDFQDRVWWLLPFEFSGYYMTSDTHNFGVTANKGGMPLMARPVLASQLGTETVYLSSFPGLATGTIDINSNTTLWGMDFNVIGYTGLISYFEDNLTSVAFVAGIGYVNLGEDLQITSTAMPLNNQFGLFFNGQVLGPGNSTLVHDSFITHNYFVGPQLGARFNWQYGPWFANLATKFAIGNMEEVVDIAGFSVWRTPAGGLLESNGGILAVASNSGTFRRDEFAFVPEGMLTVGLEFNNHLRAHVGYDLLYLSTVVRPGDHVNRTVDTRQVPTDFAFDPTVNGTNPTTTLRTTDFWMQSFSIGVTFMY